MPTYRLDISYEGTSFHGYARQDDVRTVQGVVEAALARVMGPVETTVAGRTDAGVHARQQVVSFVMEPPVDVERLVRSLNGLLPADVAALACREAGEGFSARFTARSRSYRYAILNRPTPDPLLRSTTWHVPETLDVEAMQRAAEAFVGEHDFASLCRRAEGRSTVRQVLEASWGRSGDIVEFRVSATSFCHRMVRSMVALCVEVGRGRVDSGDVPGILAARDRAAAKGAAPSRGLVLWGVAYPDV
ncbi:MAG: tRNA pseudouridine(38-40) synthase TruA [Acidimicrobiia bacterium]